MLTLIKVSSDSDSLPSSPKLQAIKPSWNPSVHALDRLLQAWLEGCVPTFLSLDVEVGEDRDISGKNPLLSVGLLMVVPGSIRTSVTLVVEENAHIQNQHCPTDHDAFAFGSTETLPLQAVVQKVQRSLDCIASANTPCVIGHSIDCDRRWLEDSGVAFKNVTVCDIAEVHRVWNNEVNNTGLANMAAAYGVEIGAKLHNAGNDANITFEVFMQMVHTRYPGL
jgi:hypothetical protein